MSMLPGLLAGLGVALGAAPLGVFVVWRRMAYFGDAVAHGALLGVALALAAHLPLAWGVLPVTLTLALGVAGLAGRGVAADTGLGVAAHGALGLGLVVASFVPGLQEDLGAYLFGDMLAVGPGELVALWLGAGLIWALIGWRWGGLLLSTIDADLALASGLRPDRERLILMAALALMVALALKLVGALLISALLIIPAAAARPWAGSPERMLVLTVLLGAAAALGGLGLSALLATPPAPSIASLALGFFLLGHLGRAWGGRRR